MKTMTPLSRYVALVALAALLPASPGRAATPAVPVTAKPAASYRLDLEVSPMAAFPFLKRFGKVDVSVFPGGVYADSSVVDAISRTGSPNVTVANPIARLYSEVPVRDVRQILVKMGGGKDEVFPGLPEFPLHKDVVIGKVRGIEAKRYRIMLGPKSWIDVWTTTVVPRNRQMELITAQMVSAMSRSAAKVMQKIPGTPIYVELNTSKHPKVVLMRMTSLQRSAQGEAEALSLGSFYARASLIEKLLH